jgi:ABC-2 type transport system permease protein
MSSLGTDLIAIRAIATNELRLLGRDWAGLLMLFLMPAMFIVTLSVALQGVFSAGRQEDRWPVLIVDDDPQGILGERLGSGLERAGYFQLRHETATRAQALQGLAERRYQVVVTVPPDSATALRFERAAEVEVILDPAISAQVARTVEASVQSIVAMASIEQLQRDFEQSTGSLGAMRAQLAEPEATRAGGRPGMRVAQLYVDRAGVEVHPDAVQQYVPGWTVFALFWLSQILAVNLLNERSSGIGTRIVASPVSSLAYVTGKLLPFLLVNLLQAVAMFAVGVLVLPLLGCPRLAIHNVPALALLTLAISLASLSFGLFLASVFRSSVLVGVVSAAALIIMSVLGGIMVPKFVMPEAMQRLGLIVPHGWALEGYHDVLMRGAETRAILPHVAALCGFAAPPFAIAVWRRRRTGVR